MKAMSNLLLLTLALASGSVLSPSFEDLPCGSRGSARLPRIKSEPQSCRSYKVSGEVGMVSPVLEGCSPGHKITPMFRQLSLMVEVNKYSG